MCAHEDAAAQASESLQVVRKTKVIATAGPSSSSQEELGALVRAGMDVLRINLAHAGRGACERIVAAYRAACGELCTTPCIFADLRGSELRSSWLVDETTCAPVSSVALTKGQLVTLYGSADLTPEQFVGWSNAGGTRIGISYANLGVAAPEGTVIRMADGSVEFTVEEALSATEVRGRVEADCLLGGHKMVCIAEHGVRLPFLSAADRADAEWAARAGVHFIAAPFTRCKEDVEELQDILNACDSKARCARSASVSIHGAHGVYAWSV